MGWTGSPWGLEPAGELTALSRIRPSHLSLEFAFHSLCGLGKVLPSLILSFLNCKMKLIRPFWHRKSQKTNPQFPGTL